MSTVDTQHPEYEKMCAKWKRCRDTVEGQDAVHDAGALYLPMLKDQTTDDYNSYRLRAQFYNAVWRTINALQGMMFRKEPIIDIAPSVEILLEDVTMSGIDFQIFAQQCAIEVLTSGRMGILVDYPAQSVEGMTLAEVEKLGLRPTMQLYKAEPFYNWKSGRVNNKTMPTEIRLMEDFSYPAEGFENPKTETHYRVLDLAQKDGTEGLSYRQRVYRIDDNKKDELIEGSEIFPLMNGKPLDYIPFYPIGIDNTTLEMDEPPLIDLVDVNLDHYRLSADLKHGLHYTIPTAWIAGYTPETMGDKLYIGSAHAWVFPDPQTTVGFLEFSAQGLTPVVTEMDRDEQRMAILGARLLSSEKKAVETAQTAQIHRAGESSILSTIAQTISIGLTKALNTFSAWAGSPGEWSIELNREFLPAEITPQELTAWVAAQQSATVSPQVVFWNLQQKEAIPPGLTYEEHQAQIESQPIPRPDIPAPVVVAAPVKDMAAQDMVMNK